MFAVSGLIFKVVYSLNEALKYFLQWGKIKRTQQHTKMQTYELPDEETCWLSGYQVKHPTVCMYSRHVPLIPAGQFGCLKKIKSLFIQ